MNLIKIKKGNGFPLVITLKDNQGDAVAPEEVAGLKTFIVPQYGQKREIEYGIQDGKISLQITPSVASTIGRYRLVITGTYLDEDIDRNPYAFEIVSNVEDERPGGSCADIELDPVLITADFVIGSSGDGSSVVNAEWGEITGNLEDQTDLIDRLNEIEDNITGEVVQEINELGFQTGSQVEVTVGQKITEHNNDEDAHTLALLPYAKKIDIPSLDGYATEDYVDGEITKLESTALTFKGFISPDEPTSDVRDGNYWCSASELPAGFPILVQVYDAVSGEWGNPLEYTPSAFDVWDFGGDSYYYFGSKWERLDFGGSTFNPNHFVVANGVVSLSNTYASLPEAIGDINAILDAINGEVI